jgi:hypothetical protein
MSIAGGTQKRIVLLKHGLVKAEVDRIDKRRRRITVRYRTKADCNLTLHLLAQIGSPKQFP